MQVPSAADFWGHHFGIAAPIIDSKWCALLCHACRVDHAPQQGQTKAILRLWTRDRVQNPLEIFGAGYVAFGDDDLCASRLQLSDSRLRGLCCRTRAPHQHQVARTLRHQPARHNQPQAAQTTSDQIACLRPDLRYLGRRWLRYHEPLYIAATVAV